MSNPFYNSSKFCVIAAPSKYETALQFTNTDAPVQFSSEIPEKAVGVCSWIKVYELTDLFSLTIIYTFWKGLKYQLSWDANRSQHTATERLGILLFAHNTYTLYLSIETLILELRKFKICQEHGKC